MIRIYLLDDHEIVRRGLRWLLESEPDLEVVGGSGSAVEAAARIPALRPDVAILDTQLPDGSGIDVCRQVRSVDPSIRCLVLTAHADDEAVLAAIVAGASGYVLKTASCDGLAEAVRRVAAGESLLDAAQVARLAERVRSPDPSDERLALLSPQEMAVLRNIAEGLSNRQIAERMFLTEKTVKNYVSNVFAKLGVERRTQAAILARRLLGADRPQAPDPR
jgi:DNA-binding NarL/FixJ family response regulator